MNTITHALLPVIAAGVYERAYLGENERRGSLSNRDILLIGVAGAAADLLDPHLSLAHRYTSWTHTMITWAGFALILAGLHAWRGNLLSRQLMAWLSGAYLLHLFCDAIAGGIAWLYPVVPNAIIGAYFVPPILWIPSDILCVLATYGIFRAIPRYHRLTNSG